MLDDHFEREGELENSSTATQAKESSSIVNNEDANEVH
jgi:hypothetical protein